MQANLDCLATVITTSYSSSEFWELSYYASLDFEKECIRTCQILFIHVSYYKS